MLRTTFNLSAISAHWGMSDEKWTPGIFVGMLPNGPPLGRPGFGSHVSNWLGAPHSQRRMQCFCDFFVSAAKTGFWKRLVKLETVASVLPVKPLRKSR